MAKPIDKRLYWAVPVAFFLVAFLGRTLFYYQGAYRSPNVPTDEPERVEVNLQVAEDAFAISPSLSGVVLVDDAHINNFLPDELTLLLGRITAAGGEVREFGGNEEDLAEELRGVKAYIVVANVLQYSAEDARAVENFVHDGGRLLIVGDPARVIDAASVNSLAGRFGVIYQSDYIYNLVENDGSYLNVFLRDFEESPLTEGVDEIVVRAAHSLRAAEGVLMRGDENTYSSLREVPGGVTAMALTTNGNVLALPDLTFIIPPYNSFSDNNRFIDNTVAFLLGGDRSFELVDFPQVFDGEVQLVYSDTTLLSEIFEENTALRQLIESAGANVVLNNNFLADQAAVIMGTYTSVTDATRALLTEDGVRITATNGIGIADVGELSATGSVLFHLHRGADGAYQLIVLGEDARSLRNGLQVLLDGRLAECLLQARTALCMPGVLATPSPTPTPSETVTPGGPTETSSGSETPTPTATPTPSG
jgi:hypothetical protein